MDFLCLEQGQADFDAMVAATVLRFSVSNVSKRMAKERSEKLKEELKQRVHKGLIGEDDVDQDESSDYLAEMAEILFTTIPKAMDVLSECLEKKYEQEIIELMRDMPAPDANVALKNLASHFKGKAGRFNLFKFDREVR